MHCRVAVVQCTIAQRDPKRNLKNATAYIAKAAAANADIVIFPEDLVAGSIEGIGELVDYQHEYRANFQALAKKYHIAIVPGSIIEGDKTGIYNTTYYIDSNGEVLATYRKVHLWLSERGDYTPGHKATVFKTKFGMMGLAICWDLAFPELFRSMAKQGANIVFCPSYWCYGDAGRGVLYDKNSEATFVDALCVERAFENEMIIVYCNAAGTVLFGKNREKLVGHSQITEPFKGAIKKFNHHRQGMFVVDIDTRILRDAEKSYQIRKDLEQKMPI